MHALDQRSLAVGDMAEPKAAWGENIWCKAGALASPEDNLSGGPLFFAIVLGIVDNIVDQLIIIP